MTLTIGRRHAVVCFVLSAVVLGAFTAAALAASSVIARVGGREITEEQVRAEIARLRKSDEIGDALKTLTPEGRTQIVENLVRGELLTLAAAQGGYADRPDVKAAIARATADILSEAYRRDVLAKADVSDTALRAYYDAHRADFQLPGRVRARHIVTATREQADAVRAELVRGADFASLARERSVDPYTRDKGGDLGWIPRGVMVKSFEQALFALQQGDVSAAVESSKGFHVIRVEAIEQPSPRSFDSVRTTLEDAVRRAHLASVQERLKTEFPVTMYPDALKALER